MQQNTVIPQWDSLPDLTWKEKIAYLTHQFLTMEQTECPVEHLFEHQLYVRDMRIPRGTLFLGRAHRHGHVCQLLEGTVIQLTQAGRRIVEAPFEVFTTPGFHMVLYALTDILGRTVHANPTESRDTDALEADIFESVDALRELGASVHARLT